MEYEIEYENKFFGVMYCNDDELTQKEIDKINNKMEELQEITNNCFDKWLDKNGYENIMGVIVKKKMNNSYILKSNIKESKDTLYESGLLSTLYCEEVSRLLNKRGYKNKIRRYADRKNYNAKVVNGYVYIENLGYTSWDSFIHGFMKNKDCEFLKEV